MEILGKKLLEKLKRKNKGNVSLLYEIDNLINELEAYQFENQLELLKIRPDADCVHKDGFYFFNINVHRTLILIEFEESGEATVVCAEIILTMKIRSKIIKAPSKNG